MIMTAKGKVLIGLVFLLASCLENDIGISPQAQLAKDIQIIDNYLNANGISTIKDAFTGIRIKINSLGDAGLPPNSGNNIKVNYAGKLLSKPNVIFGEGTTYEKLPNYIVGWQIGLSRLPEGSNATLYIPSGYGYGSSGAGSIPPNANLIFDVEIESVTNTASQNEKFTDDTTAIATYLETHEINAIKGDSGIWYSIQEGTGGASPTSIYSQVKLRYTVKRMAEGGVVYFDEIVAEPTPNFSSRLVNFPQGAMIGLQLLKAGDTGVFYVPSVLGYGPSGYNDGFVSIPANANLIIEIELLEVIN
jgi:FKBP-type peptidyl-prolyl cis-trans isomerase FkpA